ncbi:hypothetical protein [Paenibacillus ihumii]|uniref:hypothetical protein n=1 Tax=Paenibacillus ihumii TaxID=687436 RepID=UPI0006D7A44D|nr:hypothetical protein [Paenibacillus ihumii]
MAGVLLLSSITSLTTVVVSSKPIESVKELHEVVVRNGFTTLDAQGQIVINTNAKEIGVSGELFEQYVNDMDSVNFGVRTGGIR